MSTLDASAHGLTREPPGTRLINLQSTAYGINAPIKHHSVPFERHSKEWTDFISGKHKTLDEATVKYLCWVPETAIDERFLRFIENYTVELKWRSLAGLIRSFHCRWDKLIPDESASISIMRTLLKQYKGTNKVLLRWQAHPDALLSVNGPRLLAEMLIRQGIGLKPFLEEWRIETQSPFFQTVIRITAATCRQQINRLPDDVLLMLFRDILSWQGWDPSALKKEIGALILHQLMKPGIREVIQRFVLHHTELGDPRLRINGLKWADVPLQARKVFIEWLQQESSFTFNEHVFQQGKGWTWQNAASRLEPLAFERRQWR
jgi:hypothetical protein